jgi:hypothetical protein
MIHFVRNSAVGNNCDLYLSMKPVIKLEYCIWTYTETEDVPITSFVM